MKTCGISVLLATLAGMAAAQPVQWRVEDGGNGHWYEFVPQFLNWDAAQAASLSHGGHLATLTSAAESNFVKRYRQSVGSWGTWCWYGGQLN